MSYAERIIERFGGVRKMSRKTAIPVATIAYWKRQGTIPAWRHDQLCSKAMENDIELLPGDFGEHQSQNG